MRVDRQKLLLALQTVEPGLSPRDIVEQSSCFVFRRDLIITYNDEVACQTASPFGSGLQGAVPAGPLTTILAKLKEEQVDVQQNDGELLVIGKGRRCGIRMEKEITLPVDHVEAPDDEGWRPLPEGFVDAVEIVQECAGKDESQFAMTCVHLTQKWIEACDNFQLTRHRLKLGVKERCLVRRDSLKNVVGMEPVDFNETAAWIHFRNSSGLVLSCRRYLEQYPELGSLMEFEGSPLVLPKGLVEAAEKAEVFSGENKDDNQVRIDLKSGKLRIKGVGSSGWYSEVKKVAYDGPELVFQISPKLLAQIVQRHNECEVGGNRLRVNGGRWVYVSSLGQVEAETTDESKEAE